MNKKNTVIAYNLSDSEIEVVSRYKKEFNYEIVDITDLNDLNNFKFIIAFINIDNLTKDLIKTMEETFKEHKRAIIFINKPTFEPWTNPYIENIFENPEKVRLEILKAYQNYIGIEKATKPFSQRLRRLVNMIRLFESEEIITMKQLVKYYKKDKRTILRDIRLLKSIGVQIYYDKEKKAYVLKKKYKPSIK